MQQYAEESCPSSLNASLGTASSIEVLMLTLTNKIQSRTIILIMQNDSGSTPQDEIPVSVSMQLQAAIPSRKVHTLAFFLQQLYFRYLYSDML